MGDGIITKKQKKNETSFFRDSAANRNSPGQTTTTKKTEKNNKEKQVKKNGYFFLLFFLLLAFFRSGNVSIGFRHFVFLLFDFFFNDPSISLSAVFVICFVFFVCLFFFYFFIALGDAVAIFTAFLFCLLKKVRELVFDRLAAVVDQVPSGYRVFTEFFFNGSFGSKPRSFQLQWVSIGLRYLHILPSFTWFYWVVPGFTGFYLVLPSFYLVFIQFYLVEHSFSEFS